MRHRVSGLRLNRPPAYRLAIRRNLMKALFMHERVNTTKAKARAIRGEAERVITIAKRGLSTEDPSRAVHARRVVIRRLADKDTAAKVFEDIAPRYVDRPGGYTRTLKVGQRSGDGAQMVILELVEE